MFDSERTAESASTAKNIESSPDRPSPHGHPTTPQRFSDQPPPTDIPSAETAFRGFLLTDATAAHLSSSNESSEFVEVVENSIQHKRAYEQDLVNVMMLSCERRFKWKSNFDFFVAAISFLIGYDATFSFLRTFGRIGVTVMIPFSVLLFCYGIPVMYLELALGQYCSIDSSLLFKRMAPALSAIGYLSWVVAFFAIISSQGIMVLCMDLIATSLSMLRDNYVFFETCHKFYNTEDCFELDILKKCKNGGDLYYNSGCLKPDFITDLLKTGNADSIEHHAHRQKESTAQYLQIYLGGFINGWIPSNPPENAVFWLVASWMVLAIVARKGIQFVVKMSYVTITALCLVMVMLFCIGLSLAGPWPSLGFFFEIRHEHILDPIIWLDTFVYISVCLKLGQGGLITLGSYNDFHSNLFRHLFIVVFLSFLCPIIAAFTLTPLFSAFVDNLRPGKYNDYDQFMKELKDFHEFEGISMTASSLMLVHMFCGAFILLFAICVLFLNLGNQMMRITLLMSSLREHFHIFVDSFYMQTMIMLLCTVGCFLNFAFFTAYGSSLFIMVSHVFLPLICSATGMLEVLTVAYAYGTKKMFTNITAMLFGGPGKERRSAVWRMVPYFNGYMMICWQYLTPFVVTVCIMAKVAFMIEHWHEQMFHLQVTMIVSVVITYAVVAFVPLDCALRLYVARWQKTPYSVMFRPHLLLFGPRKPKDRRLAQRLEERYRI